MMIETQNPNHLWAKPMKIVTYILNRRPIKSNDKITFEELLSRIKLNLDHLRVFGCKSYVHIPKEETNKLSSTTFERIVAGYDENPKAYMIYDPRHRKIITNKDVKLMIPNASIISEFYWNPYCQNVLIIIL